MWTVEEANKWADEWGFNCGPAAICAVTDMTPEELRPSLGDFEKKGYTNPTLMRQILARLGLASHWAVDARGAKNLPWPTFGLVRVQWSGPWCRPGVPMRARYNHTHWVATKAPWTGREVFDVNATCTGGWIPFAEWAKQLVPWLIRECEPKADGRWWPTHSVELLTPSPERNDHGK